MNYHTSLTAIVLAAIVASAHANNNTETQEIVTMKKAKKEQLPTLLDISPTNGLSLDEAHAVKMFLGKNHEQALELLRDNFLFYQEDLAFMGPRAFRYYLTSLVTYITEELQSDPSNFYDTCYSLMTLFSIRLLSHEDRKMMINDTRAQTALQMAITRLTEIEANYEQYILEDRYLKSPKDILKLRDKLRAQLDQISSPT